MAESWWRPAKARKTLSDYFNLSASVVQAVALVQARVVAQKVVPVEEGVKGAASLVWGAAAVRNTAQNGTQDAYYRVHLGAESRRMMPVKEEAADAEMAYCDAADAEGSTGGCGSGAGCGNALEEVSEDHPRVFAGAYCGGKAALVIMEYGVLRLIMRFLPMKRWCTVLPAVFAGAMYAAYEGEVGVTYRQLLARKSGENR